MMGSPTSEADRRDDEVQHSVTLSRGYWMSDHETTQAEYKSVMGSNRAFGWWMERADEKGVKETARHKPLKMLSYVGEYT